jgi:hypothetical protein
MKRIAILAFTILIALTPRDRCAVAGHDYARWEKDIAAFEKADKKNPPPRGGVLFVGSSTIVRWKTLAADFPNHSVINRGFGGNQICDSTYYAERMIFPYEPGMIFLRAGGNDINSGKSPEQVFGEFKDFVAKVRRKFPKVPIVYIGVAPTVARWKNVEREKKLNSLIGEFAKQNPDTAYIDCDTLTLGPDGQPRPELFVEDKLHLNADGYKLLVERVRPYLPK